jgi:putative flippase GtrA
MEKISELWRYYRIGVLNTIFGAGLYFILVMVGFNLFVAQVLAHIVGMVFNYFMFKAHVFHGVTPRVAPYVASYGFNYLLSVLVLSVIHKFIASPYLAGAATMGLVSIVNYFVLKGFVFTKKNNPP